MQFFPLTKQSIRWRTGQLLEYGSLCDFSSLECTPQSSDWERL